MMDMMERIKKSAVLSFSFEDSGVILLSQVSGIFSYSYIATFSLNYPIYAL